MVHQLVRTTGENDMGSIRQMPSGSWRVVIRVKGHPQINKTFKTEAEATRFEKAAERKIRSGGSVKRASTVAQAVEAFREFRDRGSRPVTRKSSEDYYLIHIERDLGHLAVDEVTAKTLVDWCVDRAEDGAGPATMGSEISKLGTVLRFHAASTNSSMIDIVKASSEILKYNGLIGASQHRERRPTMDELRRLRNLLPPILAIAMDFAIATGMRRGEICSILWADVDEGRKCILVRNRKNPQKRNHNQLVPLTSHSGIDAWGILQTLPRSSERIFPITTEWLSDTFRETCSTLGIEDLRFHDLRHEATSRFFEAGLQIQQVAVLTGHAKWEHLQRYTNLRPESLHALGNRPDTEPGLDSQRT